MASRTRLVVALLVSFSQMSLPAHAERLPVKVYTTTEGLPRNNVNAIIQDSRGFLWLGTHEGLSRFDGYSFTNFGMDKGLPSSAVYDLLETREGVLWVATAAGLCRFDPNPASGKPMFETFRPDDQGKTLPVNSMAVDSQGGLWYGTEAGLYRLRIREGRPVSEFIDLGGSATRAPANSVNALLFDHQGSLWVGTADLLRRRLPDGRVETYTTKDGLPTTEILSLGEDSEGQIWVGTANGLCRLVARPEPGLPLVERHHRIPGDAYNRVLSFLQSRGGEFWIGTAGGLLVFDRGFHGAENPSRTYSVANGLGDQSIACILEDKDGSLWLGTGAGGLTKVAQEGFTSYDEGDGLTVRRISAILQSQSGDLLVIGNPITIQRFDGRKFTSLVPKFPGTIRRFGWGFYQTVMQDHAGEWWIPTGDGLCRYPKLDRVDDLARTLPTVCYTTSDGLPSNELFRVYEDAHGDVWVGTIGWERGGLARWDRASGSFQNYGPENNVPEEAPTAFGEDSAGQLWIGFYGGAIGRFRQGRFERFSSADGWPSGPASAILSDHAGRLWIATARQGLVRIDDPKAPRPRFVTYTKDQGLACNDAASLVEDAWGRIYIGTPLGVDRLTPESGHVRHYTTADGLSTSQQSVAFRDREGRLWFGTLQGVGFLVPHVDRPASPPPVFISGLRVAGTPWPVSAQGSTGIAGLTLAPDQKNVQIDFVGLAYGIGKNLRYQLMLEGADRDWTAPTDLRTVSYANLAPGDYRFLVRAVDADGVASSTPATVAFRLLAPVWMRWWFLALAAAILTAALAALYRNRVERLLMVERVRTRLARDLHDDIGSSLSRIAILSEVASRQAAPEGSAIRGTLSSIGDSAREVIESVSDIVWAMNPGRDSLADLAQKMRRFADDVFSARDIELRFEDSGQRQEVKLGPEVRREVFLILKEAVNNAVRHSGCTRAEIELRVDRESLSLMIGDNGRGFDPAATSDGNGLQSIRARAERLGGHLDLATAPGKGTRLELLVPLSRKGTYAHT